jgi:hypothetical protein
MRRTVPAPDGVRHDEGVPADLPRVVAWLRTAHPAAADDRIAAVIADADRRSPGRPAELERALADASAGCRPPRPEHLAALIELEDRLAAPV